MRASRPGIGRVVRQHVVRAVVLHDAIEGGRKIVAVDDGESAGLIRQDAEAVLRQAQLVLQRSRSDPERRIVGERSDFDRFVAEIGEAARVDAVDRHVRPRRRGNRIARLVENHRRVAVVRSALRDQIVDVIVDPFAEQQDCLAAPVHRCEPLRHVLQRLQRIARVERSLGVLGIVQRVALLPKIARAEVLRRPVRGRRIELASLRPVERRKQQPLVAGEFLVRVGRTGGVNDRHQIVGAQAALDELLPRRLDALRASEPRVQVVDHHHVHPAVERTLVRLHVRLDRRGREQRTIRPLDRNVHEGERIDRLRLPVLEHLKIFLFQIADEISLPVGDDDVDFDVVDLDAEGRLLRLRRGALAAGKYGAR